ncbi:MAG: hypothetical protein KDA37_16450 [Planctomycetales bacterium]|nr:hypothetical protein [Planctomycetales bacterium]
MDFVLREFIAELAPVRVLLVGNYAANLLDEKKDMKDREAFKWKGISVIPLWRPSPPQGDPEVNREKSGKRLGENY